MFASNQTVQRIRNRALVLRCIYDAGRTSRVDLSRSTGLMKSSITNIINELMDAGIVVEGEAGVSGSSGGRKPVFLSLNPTYCCFLGIELQPGKYRAVVLDLNGMVLLRKAGELNRGDRDFDRFLDQVYEEVGPSIDSLGIPLKGISVGVPGHVDPDFGIIYQSIPHDLSNYHFDRMANPWGIKVDFDNDARCCAWSELVKSRRRQAKDFVSVLLEFQEPNERLGQDAGISIGFGLVLNGDVYYGRDGGVGEFKSYRWTTAHRSQLGITDEALARAASDVTVQRMVVDELVANLIPMVSILAPERIVFCGEASSVFPLLEESLAETWKHSWMAQGAIPGSLVLSNHGEDAVAMGAAGKILVSLFNPRDTRARNPRIPTWEDLLGEEV